MATITYKKTFILREILYNIKINKFTSSNHFII